MHPNPRMVNVVATGVGGGALVYLSMLTLVPALGAIPALGISIVLGAIIGYVGPHTGAVVAAIPKVARETMPNVAAAMSTSRRGLRTFFRGFRPMFWYSVVVAIAAGWIAYSLAVPNVPAFSAAGGWMRAEMGGWYLPWIIPILVLFIGIASTDAPPGDFPGKIANRAYMVFVGCGIAIAVACPLGGLVFGAFGPLGVAVFAAVLWAVVLWVLPSIFVGILGNETWTERWADRLTLRRAAMDVPPATDAQDPELRALREEIGRDARTFERQMRAQDLLSNPFSLQPWWAPILLYGQALRAIVRWSFRCLWAIGSHLLWHWPIALGKFFVLLVRLVHTEIRLMCAVDVPLGGITAYAIARTAWGEQFTSLPSALQLGMSLGAGVLTLGIVLLNMKCIAPLVAKTAEHHPQP
ncbi:hypothetical protein HYV74_04585 [Candidatus Uhrbacteria bacterium]|nr:hypothetical protein [Candidatus Uhrbacteria bacterium]